MQKQAPGQVYLNLAAQQTLLIDISNRPKIEACGLLLGHTDEQANWWIEEVKPLRNIFDSPVYFEFAPEEVLAVDLQHPGKIVGVYHSHPTGLAVASETDRKNMQQVNITEQIPWCWLIISGPFKELTAKMAENVDAQIFADLPKIAYHHYDETGLQKLGITLEASE